MPPRDRFAGVHCSVARAAGLVGDPWTLLILRDLFLGVTRYDQLRRDLGIATNVLADRLDALVTHGLAERFAYSERPLRHEYHLTDAGQDLYGVVLTLMAWGDRHLAPEGPPLLLRDHHCGRITEPRVVCAHCGRPLTPSGTSIQAGPGGAAGPGTAVIAERLAGARSGGIGANNAPQ